MHSGSASYLKNSAPTSTTTTYNSQSNPPAPCTVTVCADSGCTDTLFRLSDAHALHNITQGGGLPVRLPNGSIITSVATGLLNTPPISTDVHIFPDEHLGKSLLSVADWTNNGCTVTFTALGVTVTHDATDRIIKQASKEPTARLWDLTFGLNLPATCANVINHQTNADFVNYAYASFGSPPTSTFQHCVAEGYLRTYPGLTTAIVNKNLPHTPATSKGHLDRSRAGQRSTKPIDPLPTSSVNDTDDDLFLDSNVFTRVYDIDDPSLAINYSDLPGKFPFQSLKGMNYILLSSFKGYIHVEAMTDRSSPSLIKAYRATYEYFKNSRQKPNFQRLDNETCAGLESFFKHEAKVEFQYLPPDNHRANKAERAIRYFKNHFISMLSTVHPDCPMSLWDQFLPQAEITANHFIPWSLDHRLSAYEGFHGTPFDFSRHPIAPVGTRVEIYESAQARESWAPHSVAGFYLGPALAHYRSYRTFAVQSQGFRISHSLDWFPLTVKMPGSSVSELILAGLLDLTRAIRRATAEPNHTSSGHPFPFDDTMTTAIQDASNLFAELARPTKAPPSITPAIQRVSAHTSPDPVQSHEPASIQRVDISTFQPSPPTAVPSTVHASHPTASRARERSKAINANATSPSRYRPVADLDLHNRQRTYRDYIGRRFLDLETKEIFQIVGIDIEITNRKSNTKAQRKGSRTPLFKFYNVNKHLSPPLLDVDYEHTRCSEILQTGKQAYAKFLTLSEDDSTSSSMGTRHMATALSASTVILPHFHKKLRWRWVNGKRCEPEHGWHPYSGEANRVESVAAQPVLNLDSTGKPLTYRSAVNGPHSTEWRAMDGAEISRLIDSKTIAPIHRSDCPAHRLADITYYKPVVKEKWNSCALTIDRRIRGTIGGDRIHYPDDVSTATADMFTVKALIHCVVSDRHTKGTDTRFATLDIKDFYLGTPLKRKEYVTIPLKYIPADVIAKYHLDQFISGSSILFEVSKCMYGLPQAGLLSHQHLVGHLATHGYIQDSNIPCLFSHRTRDIQFTLVVDDFGVKYSDVADIYELVRILELEWPIKLDLTGKKYLGYQLDWDYATNVVTLSMPDYIPKALVRFAAGTVLRGAASPALYTPPSKGKPNLGATPSDDSPEVSAAAKQFVQEVNGVMLYYARAVDHLLLPACTAISSQQAHPTQNTVDACWRVLNYAHSHPNQALSFRGCDMVLKIKSDASYLSRPNSGSVAGGFHYCGNQGDDTIYGVLFAMSSRIPTVCAAVSEAEYAALFINGQYGAWERQVLAALRYPQPVTHIETDNETAKGIAQRTCTVKRSKAIAMRYHWIRDRVSDGEFKVYWATGKNNLADFFTKPQPDWRHREFISLLSA